MKNKLLVMMFAWLGLFLALAGCTSIQPPISAEQKSLAAAQQAVKDHNLGKLAEQAAQLSARTPDFNMLCPYDTNEDSYLDDKEILNMIDAWINQEISDSQMLDGLKVWITGAQMNCAGPEPIWRRLYEVSIYPLVNIKIPGSLYDNAVTKREETCEYRSLGSTWAEYAKRDSPLGCYWTHTFSSSIDEADWLKDVAAKILNFPWLSRTDSWLTASLISIWVQLAIEYDTWEAPPQWYNPDEWTSWHPYDDQWVRYPVEVLAEGHGDCEDTSILTVGLWRAAALDPYGIGLAHFPGHIEPIFAIPKDKYYSLKDEVQCPRWDQRFTAFSMGSWSEASTVWLIGSSTANERIPLGCVIEGYNDVGSLDAYIYQGGSWQESTMAIADAPQEED